ncbi:cupin domain-containing protein [Amycolatopsis sp. NPDC059090]|uniref:cupin domain-containing protein n=1 Tax=Amycolatopsis sp. NPDC059090 TaxID=3346723 RepID=UPI00366C2108
MSLPPIIPAADERTRSHLGGLLTVRATAAGTNGMVGLVEERALRGYTTPPHVHSREDETLYVLSGEIEYAVDGMAQVVQAGESAFLPRHRPHTFRVVSDEAHFILAITPAGFESFFAQVSPAAAGDGIPGEEQAGLTDPRKMAEQAQRLGCRVFAPVPETPAELRDVISPNTEPARLVRAYDLLEELVCLSPDPARLPAALADGLVTAASRANESTVHARALLLLGILAERTGNGIGDHVAALLRLAQPGSPKPVVLALVYLFAHFPANAPAIEQAFDSLVLSDADRYRLRRCLKQPNFASRAPLDTLGRVWPSPATWSATDAGRDRRWRDALRLDGAAIGALWEAETAALLAFLGARAEHSITRGTDVRA